MTFLDLKVLSNCQAVSKYDVELILSHSPPPPTPTHPITPQKNPLSEPEGFTMKWKMKIYIFLNHDKNYKTIWHL